MLLSNLQRIKREVLAESLFEYSLWRGGGPSRSAPVLGRRIVEKAAGVNFPSAPEMFTLQRPRTGALRNRALETRSNKNLLAAGRDFTHEPLLLADKKSK